MRNSRNDNRFDGRPNSARVYFHLRRLRTESKKFNIQKMHFTNRIRALAANMLQNAVRQETTRIRVPSSRFSKRSKTLTSIFFLHNGMLHNWVRQETTEIHVPSSRFENAKKPKNIKRCNSRIGSGRSPEK